MADLDDVRGMWWLPDDPEHEVPGVLSFSKEAGGQLVLHSELRRPEWIDNSLPDGSVQRVRSRPEDERSSKLYPRIHGRTGRTAFNLEDCFSVQVSDRHLTEYATEKIHVNRVLKGAWFELGEEVRFDRATADLRHLTIWVGHSGLTVDADESPRSEGAPFAVLRADFVESFDAKIGGGDVQFMQSLVQDGDHLSRLSIEQKWLLRLSQDELMPLSGFLELVSDVQDLVSVASGVTCDVDSLSLEHPEVPLLSVGGTRIGDLRAPINYYARWANLSSSNHRVTTHELYFSFDDLGRMVGVQRWMQFASNFRTELGRVMATRYSTSMYLEDRIMNVCAALESLDGVRRGNVNERGVHLVDRLTECIALAGGPFIELIDDDPLSWARRVKDSRHALAHHLETFRSQTTGVEHLMAEQLFWLFVICALRMAEAPEEVFASIARHPQWR